mgnify:CR=1 FL=1
MKENGRSIQYTTLNIPWIKKEKKRKKKIVCWAVVKEDRSFISVVKEGGSMKERPWRPWGSSRKHSFTVRREGRRIWDLGFVQLRRRRGGLCSEKAKSGGGL